jgi:integrase/recombinase XerD
MATYKPYLNPTIRIDGTQTVLLRITKNRKHVVVSLNFSIRKRDWRLNSKNGNYIRDSHPLFENLNKRISEEILEFTKIELISNPSSAIEFKQLRQTAYSDKVGLIRYAETYLKRVEASKAIATYRKRKCTVSRLKEFKKNNPIYFSEVSVSFLRDFEHFLFSKGNGKNTVGNHIRIVRTILYSAIKEGHFDQGKNPFFKYTIEKEKVSKPKLTEEELKIIESLGIKRDSLLWQVRNIFMFSYYCHGMRSGDAIRLKWASIQNERLIYVMGKTKTIKDIALSGKAKLILKDYTKKNDKDYVFPFLVAGIDDTNELLIFNRVSAKNSLINKYLKILARKAGIPKKLSFHISRHSFASIARDKTRDISSIQKALGHTSIKVTEAYLSSISNDQLDEFSIKVYGEEN